MKFGFGGRYLQAVKRLVERIRRRVTSSSDPREIVVSLKPEFDCRGHVLLSYIIDPFLLGPSESISSAHTHHWESRQMAQTFLDLGFAVDVISYENKRFVPQKSYDMLVDARWNIERLAPIVGERCVKVAHLDTANILFQDIAESQRLLDLQKRRGATLQPRRYERPNLSFDLANYAVLHGNKFTADTYAYLKKPLFLIATSSALEVPFPEGRNVDACRRNFLWLGSGGMVHKGLDLVLEAFVDRPNFHLTVCGPIKQEKDFEKAYFRELYETSNIKTVGWIDVTSSKFSQIAQRCIGLVYPSSSEGQAGSVVTALNAGLIPIVSYQSGVDVQDFGLVLEDCSIAQIQSALDVVSNWPAEKLEEMAHNAWEYARKNHTRQVFAENYRRIIEQILSNQNHRPSP